MQRFKRQPYEKPQVKRRGINTQAEIVTSDEAFQRVIDGMEAEEKKKTEKAQKASAAKGKKGKANKKSKKPSNKAPVAVESETDDEIVLSNYSESDQDDDISPFPLTESRVKNYLKGQWLGISSPDASKKDVIGKWFAAVFYGETRKNGKLYVGKATKRFDSDKGGIVASLEVSCLKPPTTCFASTLEEHPNQSPDIGTVDAYDIIATSLNVDFIGKKNG